MNLHDVHVLAIETSSRQGSVAIGRGDVLLGEAEFTAGARHGVELVPAIDGLVKRLGLTPNDLRVVCVSAGPGSFTGLRVGFTFARCLAQVTGAQIVAVPSTDVVIENLRSRLEDQAGPIDLAAVRDAKRKQVYTAGFRWQEGRLEKVLPECVITPAELLDTLKRPLWITGEGIDYHQEGFADREGVLVVDRELWFGRAANVLKLGVELARQGRFTPYNGLVPIYVRLPEAEERWQQRNA